MKQFVFKSLLLLLVVFAALYAADYGFLQIRVARNREPFGTVTVHRYYAVQKKNGKTEFMFDPPQDQQCVHSIFPHLGYPPCWRLERNPEQKVNI
jgi:hypothetical protein